VSNSREYNILQCGTEVDFADISKHKYFEGVKMSYKSAGMFNFK
jgi:hypothetical protein